MHGKHNIDSMGLGSQVPHRGRGRVLGVMFQDYDAFLLLVK